MKILIIGGTRFVGPYLVQKLLDNKHEVTVFTRGMHELPKGVAHVQGDRGDGFASVTEHYDTVIDMCAYRGAQTQAALDQLHYDHFIHFGTIASYQKADIFPLNEDAPQGAWPFMGEYGAGKVECENVLAKSNKKYAIIRPTYVLGANNYADRERFIYHALAKGDNIVLPGNGQAVVQFVFADEVAEVLLRLAEKQLTGAYNCVGDDIITLQGLVEAMADISDQAARISFNPDADGDQHNDEEFPFANENLIFTNQKAKDLGVDFAPLRTGLQRDYDAYYSKHLD